ncbi:hypothetical protein WJX74_006861 [Apatococcus lobatus]|uniref:NADH dehydrogenase [ubiquinone] 1 alpha subcomplex subunit 7 n=1 Tax=Apatococcus lobatus TaxID=904363 RepID=A0AAW1SCI0_9CHLO
MAKRIAETVTGFVQKLGLRPPWKVTGVVSTVEYKEALPEARDFRRYAPGSHPVRPSVPHNQPEHVYNTRYYPRDTRREGMLVGGTNKKHMVTYHVDPREDALEVSAVPPTAGVPHKWGKKVGVTEYENNGYTL